MANESAEARVIRRSIAEPEFRAQLTADPKSTLAAELGMDLPADMVVRVIEEEPNTVYLLLPPVDGNGGDMLGRLFSALKAETTNGLFMGFLRGVWVRAGLHGGTPLQSVLDEIEPYRTREAE